MKATIYNLDDYRLPKMVDCEAIAKKVCEVQRKLPEDSSFNDPRYWHHYCHIKKVKIIMYKYTVCDYCQSGYTGE